MRDKTLNSKSFCSEVRKYCQNMVSKYERTLSNHVSDIPKQSIHNPGFYFLGQIRKLDDVLALSLVSWYFPEELQYLLQEDIRRVLSRYSQEDKFLAKLFLQSEPETILFLIESSLWHTRDFFGNFLERVEKVIRKLTTYTAPKRKPRKSEFCRGYRDHGHWSPTHRWKPVHDVSLTEEQNEIEKKRIVLQETLTLTRYYLW